MDAHKMSVALFVLIACGSMVLTAAQSAPSYCDTTDPMFLFHHAALDGTIPVDPLENVWFQNVTYYVDVNPDPDVTEYEFEVNFSYLQRQYYEDGTCKVPYEHVEACGMNTWCVSTWHSEVLSPQMLVPGRNGPPDTPRSDYRVIPPTTPRYDKRGSLQLSFESRALSSNAMITVANVPQYDVTAFTEIITNNVPKQRRSYELVFAADPSTGTPKRKGHFDSQVVPISSLSAGEQSVFSAIDNGELQMIQDPLAEEEYLVPGHVYSGRSVGNTLHTPPNEAMRRTPWYQLSEALVRK